MMFVTLYPQICRYTYLKYGFFKKSTFLAGLHC